MRLYAIGDVHGRLDLLEKMHARIREEIEQDKPADWRVIHLGDYVDRGPQSRQVIELLMAVCARDSRFIALAGNHDHGLVEFLAEPSMDGLFMQNGGIETAASYGVAFGLFHQTLRRFHADLLAAVPGSTSVSSCHASSASPWRLLLLPRGHTSQVSRSTARFQTT